MKTRWVIAGGARRSGSTLQYHLAREIILRTNSGHDLKFVQFLEFAKYYDEYDGRYNYLIAKSHAHLPSLSKKCASIWEEGRGYGLFIHRNYYDVMVSVDRLNKQWTKWWGRGKKQPEGTLFRDMRRIVAETNAWLDTERVLVTAYNDILTLDGLVTECERIAAHIEIEIPRSTCLEIAAEHTIDKQIQRVPSEKVDPDTGLYASHIDMDRRRWQERLTQEEMDYCEEVTRDLRARLGYD